MRYCVWVSFVHNTEVLRLLRHPAFFRVIVVLYVGAIFALVGSYIAVSRVDIAVSVYLQAPAKLTAERATAARGIVMNAPTGKLFVDAVTTFAIDGVEVGQAKTQSHGHLHAQLEPPVNLVGTRKLDIVVRHPQIEAFRTSVDVEIVRPGEAAAWPEATSRRSEGARTTEEEWEGELRVRLLPTNGELPRGLSSVAYLLLTDAEGKPVQGAIKFEKVEGMLDGELAREYRTDALGLAQIELTPVTSLKIEVAATDADGPPEAADSAPRTGEGSLWVDAVVSQFSMRPTQSLAVPGLPVEALVSSLHRSGGVLVDRRLPRRRGLVPQHALRRRGLVAAGRAMWH